MRFNLTLFFFPILIFNFIQLISAQNIVDQIKGKIVDRRRSEIIQFAMVSIETINGNTIEKTITDDSGYFKLYNLPTGEFFLKVAYIGYGDTAFRIGVSKDTSYVLDIHKPCKYDSSINDKTCPICHKQDMVVPIIYGEFVITKQTSGKKSKRQDNPYIDFYPGGCVVTYCDPNWFCNRDKVKF